MDLDFSTPVLVVDDYTTMVRIIRNLLKQVGFENTDSANDAETALAMMREKSYGLVISDWNMDPTTGYELLKQMRSDSNLDKTVFIMVSTNPEMGRKIHAVDAGADGYLVKPFNAATLKVAIEVAFATRHAK